MKSLVLAFLLASIAHALPQGPPPTPKVIGELPKEGLQGLPYPDFNGLAKLLGFDPAKATPDGTGKTCQTSANGKFCFDLKNGGGSFILGHPGGAFDGEKWNPFEGPDGVGTPGGLFAGAIGSADDIA